MFALARKLLHEAPGTDTSCHLVFRGELADQVDDPWMKRIIILADGKPVEEISQALYLEEFRAGAEMADIGLWRNLFFNEVDRTLNEMSERRYIQLIRQDLQLPEDKPRVI